jgi:hemolysin activation/secretion protein
MMYPQAYAAQIPQGQDAGSRLREYENEKMRETMKEELAAPKPRPPAVDEAPITALPDKAKAVFVSKTILQKAPGVNTPADEKALDELTTIHNNRMLSIEDMETLTDLITQFYADKKLKAYIPKQSFAGGVMYINIVTAEQPKMKK